MSKTTDSITSEKTTKVSVGSATFYNEKKNSPAPMRPTKTPPKFLEVFRLKHRLKKARRTFRILRSRARTAHCIRQPSTKSPCRRKTNDSNTYSSMENYGRFRKAETSYSRSCPKYPIFGSAIAGQLSGIRHLIR
jgi:hypothetical protein